MTFLNDKQEFSETPLDIVVLLKDVLQEKSRQRLCHLNVGSGVEFTPNWLEEVLDFIPFLESLAIQNRQTTFLPDFFKLSKTFELINTLDLSRITISSFEGISNFPNLENLILHNTEIQKSESIKEISKLKKLIELDVSGSSTSIASDLVRFCDSLPETRFIDFCSADIGNPEIQDIQKIAPKLEKIAMYITYDYDENIHLRDGLECLRSIDLQSTIQLCRYLESKNRTSQMSECIRDMKYLINDEIGERGDCPSFHEFLLFLCELFDNDRSEKDVYHIVDCFKCYTKNWKQFLRDQEKVKIALTMIKVIPRVSNGIYAKEEKTDCWTIIRDVDILSIPGAPDIRSALMVAVFDEQIASHATVQLLRTLVATNKISKVFKDDQNYAFWVNKSVRLLDSMKPREKSVYWDGWTSCALDHYKMFINMCNNYLSPCRSEIDIEDVIILIGHLKLLDGYEELLHSVTKAIRSMILLVDHMNLYRIDKGLITELFKNIYGDLLRYNPRVGGFLENHRARSSIVILKYILSYMRSEDFAYFRQELLLELTKFIRDKNPPEFRIPVMNDGGPCPSVIAESHIGWANGVIEEVVKQVRSFKVPTHLFDGQARNVYGQLLKENLLKGRSVSDVLENYSCL